MEQISSIRYHRARMASSSARNSSSTEMGAAQGAASKFSVAMRLHKRQEAPARLHALRYVLLWPDRALSTLSPRLRLMSAQLPLLRAEALRPRPLLKWAGGKTQLLPALLEIMPKDYGRYIEPFFGGGALFFALQPRMSIIADSNPELVNLYRTVARSVDDVIRELDVFQNTDAFFYEVRSVDWRSLTAEAAAARTIFLNKTCFNGLYRVNKSGQFNVPFGRYKNPRIIDEPGLRAAAALLQSADIQEGDFQTVLSRTARKNDLVFLDPPYLPVSEYADFKRYTKEQFYEEDHRRLALEVDRLSDLGCHVILTNSNHPLVHELYGRHRLQVVRTRRHISSSAKTRTGEDVVVMVPPRRRVHLSLVPAALNDQALKYPSTRFMGSKRKLLEEIWGVARQFKFSSVLDLFAGSGVVGYMFKAYGKRVFSNDHMAFAATYARAMIANSSVRLDDGDIDQLLSARRSTDEFVSRTFRGLYFSDEDNRLIDTLRFNIREFDSPVKREIAMAALVRTCFKKRPRGIFTYTGDRYNDGRRDLQMSFADQFKDAVSAINQAVFANGHQCVARRGDAMSLTGSDVDLVYLDPPYYSPFSDNEYVRRYHFVEGLARDWTGVEIQQHTTTKKFRSYPTPFSSRVGATDAFDQLFQRYRESVLLVSYSSNSLPSLDEMTRLLAKWKSHVDVVPIQYRYGFGNQSTAKTQRNTVQEYLFVAY